MLFDFDPDQGRNRLPTAKLTPEYEKRLLDKLDRIERGVEFDPLSNCAPPGHPRWLTEPFLREFVPTPDQTYLINEMVNDIRRIYTDGRDHVPEADRYPLYNGDSIGFWDEKRLVIHTNQLTSGQYQRTQPEYSDQVETVEIWEKVDDKHDRRARLGLRSAVARRAVVREADVHEARQRRPCAAHSLLGLRREPEQHRDSDRQRVVAVSRFHVHVERRQERRGRRLPK